MVGVDILAVLVATGYSVSLLVLTLYGIHWGWWAAMRNRYTAPPPPPAPDEWPAVTVQIPLYNEPKMAARVIDACAQLDYPNDQLHIQVLDDSTDATSKHVASRVAHWREEGRSIAHIQRNHRSGYKAGALAHGLTHTDDAFVAVFDADFIPPEDFLRALIPHFQAPEIGMVQARWAHCNPTTNWCTQSQAVGLNAHFGLEQAGRSAGNYFMHFNGTAGIWRRTCIEDAGGWSDDTLTEDLDLSYRAQLAGWAFTYVDDVTVPAELPSTVSAWRIQQFRWTKGAIETARKLLIPLWKSARQWRTKVAGTLHLLAHTAFPAIIGAALLHAPLLLLAEHSAAVSASFLGILTLGIVGFVAFGWAVWKAQRATGSSVAATLLALPAFYLGSMGLAVNNTRAVYAALQGIQIPFRRTPKGEDARPSETSSSTSQIWEAVLGLYCTFGLGALIAYELWIAVPFQGALAASFLLLAVTDWWQTRHPPPSPRMLHSGSSYSRSMTAGCKEAANPV